MIGNIKPFDSLAEKDFARLISITKIATLTEGQRISMNDRVAVLCQGEIFGYCEDKFPLFHGTYKLLIPCGLLCEIRVISKTAVLCFITWTDFRRLLVSDLSLFYEGLVRVLQTRFDPVNAIWRNEKMRPDFQHKVNQIISDITTLVRNIPAITSGETPSVAHAAWVSALRRIDPAVQVI